MPKTKAPSEGDRYRFTADAVGTDAGRVSPGTVVTVREVVPASEPGAHDDSSDAVVVEWTEPTLGVDDNGEPAVLDTPRAWSVSVDEFTDLFEKE